MDKTLSAALRLRLKELKAAAHLSDTQLAAGIREINPDERVYQQKVSDFFNGEMKNPGLAFLAALCAALGVKLSTAIAAAEREAAVDRDEDWEWLMFGRRLGSARRADARRAVEGDAPPVAPASPPKRRPKIRRRASSTG